MGKLNLRNGEVISAAVLAVLGVYIVLQARAWNYSGPDGPGPGFFPIWYGLAMVGLALLLIGRTVLRADATASDTAGTRTNRRGLATWIAFAAAIALMNTLGFIVSFGAFTFFLVAVMFRKPPLTAALTAISTAAVFYLTFPLALGVSLPKGVFGF